jgi:DNA-binding SARP family transcriptional activator
LAYLSRHDYELQRDNLAALLWPNLDQQRARAALRRTLSPLNQALGKEALITTRETVMLNPDFSLWVDERAFDQLIAFTETHGHTNVEVCNRCIKPLEEALDYYRGEFMKGFTLRDSAAFDDWQFAQSERLHRTCSEILEKLTFFHEREKDFEKGLRYGHKWLEMDQLHEPAHRALMRLYLQNGQRSQALLQYRKCLRILDKELGVSPLEETTELYQDILENRIDNFYVSKVKIFETNQPKIITPGLEVVAPMVGRDSSTRLLDDIFQAASGNGQLVVIEGEIGIGKTRLAEEFIDYAQTKGAIPLRARCYEGEKNLAYSPIIAALRSIVNKDTITNLTESLSPVWQHEAARLLPELPRPELHSLDFQSNPTSSQSHLYEAVRQILLILCSPDAPGVLFIDDLQWADTASLDLLAYINRRLDNLPLMIIVTWRSEDVPPHDPLRNLYSEAAIIGNGSHINLDRLNEQEVSTLVEYFKSIPKALKENLYAWTEGLPFFVIEYLTADIHSQSGDMPESVREIQKSRLTKLDEVCKQLLTTAAIIGRSFDFETLRFASGRSEEETIVALETLLRSGLLLEKRLDDTSGDMTLDKASLLYDFSHDSIYQIVLDQTSLARQRLLNRRVADSYLTQYQRIEENAARIGYHLSRSGEEERAAKYYFMAGEHDRMLYANEEALNHFQTAVALGHPNLSILHEAIGDLMTLRGEYQRAVNSYEKSASFVEKQTLPHIERKLANVHHRRGDYDLAMSYFQTALEFMEEVGETPGLRAMIHIDWSRTASQTGDVESGRQHAEMGLKLSIDSKDRIMESFAHNVLGIIDRKTRRPASARTHLESALAAAEGHLPARIAVLNNLALLSSDEGHYQEAIELTQLALEACTKIGDRHREAALRNHLADRLHENHQREEAMVELKKAVEIFAEIGKEMGDLQPEIWKLVEW